MSQLNINESQANGGLGAVMGVAQKFLGQDFSQVSKAIPGVEGLIANAPQAETSGLGGMLGGVMSALGQSNSNLALINTVVGQFKTLGLDANTVTQFLPVVMNFLKSNNNTQAADLIQKVIGQLKP